MLEHWSFDNFRYILILADKPITINDIITTKRWLLHTFGVPWSWRIWRAYKEKEMIFLFNNSEKFTRIMRDKMIA